MLLCPVCKRKIQSAQSLKARNGYQYFICSFCTAGVLMPRKKALLDLKKTYQSEYFDWKEAVGLRKYFNKIQLFLPYPDWITQFKKQGKLLDIGAGVPKFVLEMKNKGWQVDALEISPEQVKIIRKTIGNKNVKQGDFEQTRLPKKSYDILTFWHMLEHLVDPAEAVNKSAEVLRPKGMLFAEFPNFDALNLKIFKQYYYYFDLPGHLIYYNKKSLQILFKENGFSNIQISYPLKLNGSFAINFSNYVYGSKTQSLLKQIIFYLFLPLSLVISIVASSAGKTDLMRISAVKK